jgi:hypothetical protein
MAVTIYDQPQLVAPAGNPLVFTFSSDETAQPNFSFIVEIYVMGQLRLTQEVFRQFNTLGRIDISEVIQSVIANPIISTDIETPFDMQTYSISVYEKYGEPPIVAIGSRENSSGLLPFNGSLEYPEWRDFNYEDYDLNFTNEAPFLTYFPRSKKAFCGNDENFYLGYLNSYDTSLEMIVVLKDITGSVIVSDSYSLGGDGYNIINVGPQVIIDNTVITQNDFDSCYYYEIFMRDIGITIETETFNIYMDTECKRYETYRLHWLNKFGSFDSFTFALVSTESATVQAFDYQRDPGVWDGTSYTYPLYSGQKIHYAKTKSKNLILNSDWISEGVQNWLVNSLFDSPLVYLEQNNGTEFEPVKVTNTSYQLKTRRRDGLIQEQISIERTYTYRSQLN